MKIIDIPSYLRQNLILLLRSRSRKPWKKRSMLQGTIEPLQSTRQHMTKYINCEQCSGNFYDGHHGPVSTKVFMKDHKALHDELRDRNAPLEEHQKLNFLDADKEKAIEDLVKPMLVALEAPIDSVSKIFNLCHLLHTLRGSCDKELLKQ